jgi:hypothetical protein
MSILREAVGLTGRRFRGAAAVAHAGNGRIVNRSVQMTRLGHKGYPLVLFCRNLTEARAAMCAELFSMFR